jgi:hypothetical protein
MPRANSSALQWPRSKRRTQGTAEPTPPDLLLGLIPEESAHRLDVRELDQDATEVEEHDFEGHRSSAPE